MRSFMLLFSVIFILSICNAGSTKLLEDNDNDNETLSPSTTSSYTFENILKDYPTRSAITYGFRFILGPGFSKLSPYIFTKYKNYSSIDGTIDMASLNDDSRMAALNLRIFEIMYYVYMCITVVLAPFKTLKSIIRNLPALGIVFITIHHWCNNASKRKTVKTESLDELHKQIRERGIHLFFHLTILLLVGIMFYTNATVVGIIVSLTAFSIEKKFIENILVDHKFYLQPTFSDSITLDLLKFADIIALLFMFMQLVNIAKYNPFPQNLDHLRLLIWSCGIISNNIPESGEELAEFLFNFSKHFFFYISGYLLDQLFVLVGLVLSTSPPSQVYEAIKANIDTSTNIEIPEAKPSSMPELMQTYERISKMTLIPETFACYSVAVFVYETFYGFLKSDISMSIGARYSFGTSITVALLSYIFRRILINIWVWVGDEGFTYKLLFAVFIHNSLVEPDSQEHSIRTKLVNIIISIMAVIPQSFIESLFGPLNTSKVNFNINMPSIPSPSCPSNATEFVTRMRDFFDNYVHSIVMNGYDLLKYVTLKSWNILASDFRFTTATLVSGTWTSVLYGPIMPKADASISGTGLYQIVNSLSHEAVSASMSNMTTYMLLKWASVVKDNYTRYYPISFPTSKISLRYRYCNDALILYRNQSKPLCDYLDYNVTKVDITICTKIGHFIRSYPLFGMVYKSGIFIPIAYLYIAYLIYENNFRKALEEESEIESKDSSRRIARRNLGIVISYFSEFLLKVFVQIHLLIQFSVTYTWKLFTSFLDGLSKSWKHMFIAVHALIPLAFVCLTILLAHLISLQTLFYSDYCTSNTGPCYLMHLYNLAPFYTYFSSLLSHTIVNTLKVYMVRIRRGLRYRFLQTQPWSLLFGSINFLAISLLKPMFDNVFKSLITNADNYTKEIICVLGLSWMVLVLCGHLKLQSVREPSIDHTYTFSNILFGWAMPSTILILFWLPEAISPISILQWVKYEFKTLILTHVVDWKAWFDKGNFMMLIAAGSTYSIICNVIVPCLFSCYESEKLVP